MESDIVDPSFLSGFYQIDFLPFSLNIGLGLVLLICLLIISALISGTEVAFFSLKPRDIELIKQNKSNSARKVILHLTQPEALLATVLIVNNFVNVGIVILAAFLGNSLISFGDADWLKFIFEVILITSLILFFGEIFPKLYASQMPRRFALFMSRPIGVLIRLFKPFSSLLIHSTGLVNRKLSKHQHNISLDDLSEALELTGGDMTDEKEMLQGIVKFSNLSAEEIMTSRVDIVALDAAFEYSKVLQVIVESGYSRIPVYQETSDNIKGVLYVKDLLPYLDSSPGFDWQALIREAYYVPVNKKINDLLAEFQNNKVHMAIVVDEYGGMAGIVTLEDVLEEIVGEISDEYDDDEAMFAVMTDGSIIFEGKILLNDFFKAIGEEASVFDPVRGDAETLAGLLLELKGAIPVKHEILEFRNFVFVVLAADNRRIKKVKFVNKSNVTSNNKK